MLIVSIVSGYDDVCIFTLTQFILKQNVDKSMRLHAVVVVSYFKQS